MNINIFVLTTSSHQKTHPLEGTIDRRLEVEGGTPVIRLVFFDLAGTTTSVRQVDLALGHVEIKSSFQSG